MTTSSSGEAEAVDALYAPWQERQHADFFDALADWSDSAIRRHYEVYNDIQLLKAVAARCKNRRLLEIGCATGDLFRYVRSALPRLSYSGGDISEAAIERARRKYPTARFAVIDKDPARVHDPTGRPGVVYCKDVVLHQVDPFGFLKAVLTIPEEAAVIRLRTRDRGKTVLDAELCCQKHYSGWVPYMVLNIDELVHHILGVRPVSRLEIIRNHVILGGREGRFLPKECYEQETGTAETAVLVEFPAGPHLASAPEVVIHDRKEQSPPFSLWQRVRRQLRLRLPGARSIFRN